MNQNTIKNTLWPRSFTCFKVSMFCPVFFYSKHVICTPFTQTQSHEEVGLPLCIAESN